MYVRRRVSLARLCGLLLIELFGTHGHALGKRYAWPMTRFSLAVSTTSTENSLSWLISTPRCICVSRRASRRKLPRVSRVIAAATSGEISFLGSCTPVGAQ